MINRAMLLILNAVLILQFGGCALPESNRLSGEIACEKYLRGSTKAVYSKMVSNVISAGMINISDNRSKYIQRLMETNDAKETGSIVHLLFYVKPDFGDIDGAVKVLLAPSTNEFKYTEIADGLWLMLNRPWPWIDDGGMGRIPPYGERDRLLEWHRDNRKYWVNKTYAQYWREYIEWCRSKLRLAETLSEEEEGHIAEHYSYALLMFVEAGDAESVVRCLMDLLESDDKYDEYMLLDENGNINKTIKGILESYIGDFENTEMCDDEGVSKDSILRWWSRAKHKNALDWREDIVKYKYNINNLDDDRMGLETLAKLVNTEKGNNLYALSEILREKYGVMSMVPRAWGVAGGGSGSPGESIVKAMLLWNIHKRLYDEAGAENDAETGTVPNFATPTQ